MRRVRWREIRDEPILGGRSYLGSGVWAAAHFGVGCVLWNLGAYWPREGVDPRLLLLPLVLGCVALLFRRSAPSLSLGVGAVAAVGDVVLLGPSAAMFLVATDIVYAVGAWGRRRLAWSVLGVLIAIGVAVAAVGAYLMLTGMMRGGPLAFIQLVAVYGALFVTPMITGLSIREHHLRAELERQRAHQVARMAELDQAAAVAEERRRMARELHDVIANHLSAVAVQSTGALSMREFDPERVRRVLEVVRDSSVQGLAEMRRMIGVLRAPDDSALERNLPQLSEAGRLVDQAREAGLAVSVEHRGESGPLPDRLDAAAYRVVQESLTNALRYAVPKRVAIVVEHRRDDAAPGEEPGGRRVVITADNGTAPGSGGTGGTGGTGDDLGAGAGLTGMRERVTLLGGRFFAGPVPDGWRVRAELPVDDEDGGARHGAARDRETGLDA
ncbi:sensor histidine kinase [Murinocardiopsis flavida]|uniref:sensor histidine kinase n=1 Tax=Murinocardiopsis flavida TaxID=645275 RepID=UPI001FE3593A|nr:histidine kinase [Murinocardiopsis flavida]